MRERARGSARAGGRAVGELRVRRESELRFFSREFEVEPRVCVRNWGAAEVACDRGRRELGLQAWQVGKVAAGFGSEAQQARVRNQTLLDCHTYGNNEGDLPDAPAGPTAAFTIRPGLAWRLEATPSWTIGKDPAMWKNPDEFIPGRFLGLDIDVKGHNLELVPFGGGHKICPGLPLAMRMLHLMLGSLLNSFDWKLEDGYSPETMEMGEIFGIILQKAQPLRAEPLPIKK
ncbi:hypothetical protein CRG98_046854 [Punica granatum]|uniref:Geraniol 8-hydroxylase-like n=1 Tax=Punica granatum TaxID=22663 RepID=A0A2I0HM60_PUNGR|nr:hypothetical protein CRG98_046854 [Punica granatum]